MVFSGKQNRNARLGQSLFTAARRPWTLFVARRRSVGAFFVRTPALRPEGCKTALRHAAARSSECADEVIIIFMVYDKNIYNGRRASRVDGGVCRIEAGLVWDSRVVAFTRSSHPICALGIILAVLIVQGQIHALSVSDAHGSRRP